MRKGILLLITILFLFNSGSPAFSQVIQNADHLDKDLIDSLISEGIILDGNRKKMDVNLTREQAVELLQRNYQPQLWKDQNDPLRIAIGQLVFEASHLPYDSADYFLRTYPYDSIDIPWDQFYIWEPVRLKVKADSVTALPADSLVSFGDILKGTVKDTVMADSSGVIRRGAADTLSVAETGDVNLPVVSKPLADKGLKDTTFMVVVDTLKKVKSLSPAFPFRYYTHPYQSDSIKSAVNVLLNFLEERDSSIINVTGMSGRSTSVWLNSKSDMEMRYWLQNDFNDSVTVWIGTPKRNTIGLYLEKGVNFKRPAMQGYISDAKVNVKPQDRTTLQDAKKIITKPQLWKVHTDASFSLSQGMVSNWVKGGENSVSTTFDVTTYADYENKPMLLSSSNFARLKYGLIAQGKDVKKNLDLLETSSKLNHKAFGKFDFSGILLFKTQVSPGKDNNDVTVSKFLNPATLTVGLGLDYKPNKLTSVNFSPLSYKATFVTDTVLIDQTKYGIDKDKKSKHEPGASFMFSNEFKEIKNVTVTNRVQLFTNYIDNPMNIDVDWEMIVVAKLNWFTDVRLNTHLIFDDDTKTLVVDDLGNQKKTARIQFKELLGFSFAFTF